MAAGVSGSVVKQCNICFNEKPEDQFAKMPRCGDEYCRDCLRESFESHALRLGVKTSFFCPCGAPISTEEALTFVSAEFSQKFHEWVAAAAVVPTLKDNVSQIWERARSKASEISNGRLLAAVSSVLLFIVSLLRCVLPSRNTLWLLAFAKKCPGCGCSVEKTGGCKHMECRSCNIHFCWHCGYTSRDSSPIYCHICRPWGVVRMSGPVGILIMMIVAAVVLWLGSCMLAALAAVSEFLHAYMPLYTLVAYYPWAVTTWVASSVWGIVVTVCMLPVNVFVALAPTPVFDAAVWVLGGAAWAWGLAWGGVYAGTDTVLGALCSGVAILAQTVLWRGVVVTMLWHGVMGTVVAFLIPNFLHLSFLTAELNAVLYLGLLLAVGYYVSTHTMCGCFRNNRRQTYYARPPPAPRRRRGRMLTT